jgi:hypothetical protein
MPSIGRAQTITLSRLVSRSVPGGFAVDPEHSRPRTLSIRITRNALPRTV